jgi:peptidoglycan/LPS O-acetylase OafA/YrhL
VLLDTAYLLLFGWLVGRAAEGFRGPVRRLLQCKPLVYVGTISYGIYVYHYFVPGLAEMAGVALPHSGLLTFAGVTLVTVALATASWFLFEKPLNDLKRHLPYHRPRVIVVTVGAAYAPGARRATAGPSLALRAGQER